MSTPEPRPIRIGNAERESAVAALGDHFAHGRLEADEYDERITAAYAARTSDDLNRLFDDLPRPQGMPPARMPPPAMALRPMPPAPDAPYGREPITGVPYSDRHKVLAGVLQIVLPFGIGRFYAGHTGVGVAQLLLVFVFGIGAIWSMIDGVLMLVGRPTDAFGRPLRP